MDYCVQLGFDNVNSPELGGYGVDHVKVAEGLGCKAVRVERPDDLSAAFEEARRLMARYRVPVLVEVILVPVTNIAMGTELDALRASSYGVGEVVRAALDHGCRTVVLGIGMVLDLVGFARHLPGAGLVITGEGSLDEQTLHGKAPAGVAAAAMAAGVPVVTVSGRVALTTDQLAAAGIRRAYALTDIEPDPARCFAEAGPLVAQLARTIADDWLKESM
jgi:glycerate kinase